MYPSQQARPSTSQDYKFVLYSALQACRYWPTGAEAPETACGKRPPDRAWRLPRRLTAIKHPIRPISASRPLSFLLYPSPHKRPPSSPPYSLAPVSGAPLASCGATSRPLQSPLCLRLTQHMPAASCSHSTTLRVGGLQMTLATMVCLKPSGRPPVYRRDAIPPRSAPSLLNSDLPLDHPQPSSQPISLKIPRQHRRSCLPCTSPFVHIHNGSSEVRIPSATAMKHGQ